MRHVEDATVNKYALAEIQFPTQKFERMADKASTMRKVLDADPTSATYNQPITTLCAYITSGSNLEIIKINVLIGCNAK